MLEKAGISSSTIESQLRIVEGDIRDVDAVKKTLLFPSGMADVIMSGIGMRLSMNFKNMDGTVCQASTKSYVEALKSLNLPKKPYIITISTTGISQGPDDVPFWFRFMYHQLLHVPHKDKRVMERDVVEGSTGLDAVFDGFTIVRASLLTDGNECGMKKIRAGTEEKPAIGYTISRLDVGRWIFETLISREPGIYRNTIPSITY